VSASAVIAIGAEDGVIDVHFFGEAVDRGARGVNSGWNTLAIIGAEALVAAGYVKHREN
jgi:hypothetical protein